MRYTALKREISKLLSVIMMIGLLLESPIIVSSDSGDAIDIMTLRSTEIGSSVTYDVEIGLGLKTDPGGTITDLPSPRYGTGENPLVYDFTGTDGTNTGYLKYTFNGPANAFLSRDKSNGIDFDYEVTGSTAAQKFTLALPQGLIPKDVNTSSLKLSIQKKPTDRFSSDIKHDIMLSSLSSSIGMELATNSIYFSIEKANDATLNGNSNVTFSIYIPFKCDSTFIRQFDENAVTTLPASVIFTKSFLIAPAAESPTSHAAVTKSFYFKYADYLDRVSVDLLYDSTSVLTDSNPLPRLNPHDLNSALNLLTFKLNLDIPSGMERGKSFDISYPSSLDLSNISVSDTLSGVTVTHDGPNKLLHIKFSDDIVNSKPPVNGCCFSADATLTPAEDSEELGYEQIKFFADNYKFVDDNIYFQKSLREPKLDKAYEKVEYANDGTPSKGFKWTVDIKPGNIVDGTATVIDTFTNMKLIEDRHITLETIDANGATVSSPVAIDSANINYQVEPGVAPNPASGGIFTITLSDFNTYNEAYTYRLTYYTDICPEVWEQVDNGTPVIINNSVSLNAAALYSLPEVAIADSESITIEDGNADWVPTPSPTSTPTPTPVDTQPIIIVPPTPATSPTPEGPSSSVTPSPEDSQTSPSPEGENGDNDENTGDSENTGDNSGTGDNDNTGNDGSTGDNSNTGDNGSAGDNSNADGSGENADGDGNSDSSDNISDSGNTEHVNVNEPAQGEIELPDGSEISEITQPEHGKVTIDDEGNWIYTPDEDYSGEDTFKIVIHDENDEEREIEIAIKVGVDTDNTDRLPQTGTLKPSFYVKMGLFLISAGIWIANRKQ